MPDFTINPDNMAAGANRLIKAAQFAGGSGAPAFLAWLREHDPEDVPTSKWELRDCLYEAALFLSAMTWWAADHPQDQDAIAAQMMALHRDLDAASDRPGPTS